jgi:citrate lyase subunit beta/citryl-CoA lyase
VKLRSLLFVPADSERKLTRAADVDADALILDLEDAVSTENKARARSMAVDFLAVRPGPTWVRINALGTPHALADLAAIVRAAPDGIMLPKADFAAMRRLHIMLDALEAREALAANSIKLLPIATETPAAVLRLHEMVAPRRLPRMVALTWGAEDLSAELGASTSRMQSGAFDVPYQAVRVQALLTARAAGVEPIETLHADFRDLHGLAADSARARTQGFTGRLAIHPDQVAVINTAFSPTEAEIAHARAVLAAFAAALGQGTVALEGKMLDAPHKRAAERVLARARSGSQEFTRHALVGAEQMVPETEV